MGRSLNRASITDQDVGLLATGARANAYMPDDPHLRARIIVALTDRIKKFFPKEYDHCKGAISAIALIEATRRLSAEQKAQKIEHWLQQVASERASRRDGHVPVVLCQQRTAFYDYLDAHGYPTGKEPRQRKTWLREHWDELMAFLKQASCDCRYRVTYKMFLEKYPSGESRTLTDTTDLVLGFLHNLSPKRVSELARRPLLTS